MTKDIHFEVKQKNKNDWLTTGVFTTAEEAVNFSTFKNEAGLQTRVKKIETESSEHYIIESNEESFCFDSGEIRIHINYEQLCLDEDETKKLFGIMKKYYSKNKKKTFEYSTKNKQLNELNNNMLKEI